MITLGLLALAMSLRGELAAAGDAGRSADGTKVAAAGECEVGSEPAADAGTAGSAATTAGSPAPAAQPGPGEPGQCVDASLQEQLLAKRKYRLTADRLYVKSLRHELTVFGGYYVSDLFDGTFDVGGSYTFFMAENWGAELRVGWSRLNPSTLDALEDINNFNLDLAREDVIRVFGSLLWSPLYGKLRLFAGSIWRYDLYFAAGPGVVVDPISFGAAGNFGVGMRVFLHPAVALRFDLRDHLYAQELLDERYIVNDLAFTAGVSLFLPPKN